MTALTPQNLRMCIIVALLMAGMVYYFQYSKDKDKNKDDEDDDTVGMPKQVDKNEPEADVDAVIANIMRKQIAQ